MVPSSRGLGHRPLTAETPVRNRLGLPKISVGYDSGQFYFMNCDPIFETIPKSSYVF